MKRICDASASRLCFRKGGCFSGFQFPFSFRQVIRRGIEAVITGLTRNQFGRKPTWVRIPPSPPTTGASPFGGAPVVGGDDRSGRTHGLSDAERRKVSFHAIRYGFPLLFVGREMAGSIIRGLPRMMRRIPDRECIHPGTCLRRGGGRGVQHSARPVLLALGDTASQKRPTGAFFAR